VSRNLYKALLRNVRLIEQRAPSSALPIIQKTVLGPDRLLPLGAKMVRKSFRAPTENVWKDLAEGFTTLRDLSAEVRRLPKTLQPVKYKVGTMFRHKAWSFIGIIYGVDPICLSEIKPEIEVKLEHGRYQPFYRVLIDDHSEFTHYVAQEWVDVIPSRPINHPKVGEYFVFKNNEYVPVGSVHLPAPEKPVVVAEAEKEVSLNVNSADLQAVVAELANGLPKKALE